MYLLSLFSGLPINKPAFSGQSYQNYCWTHKRRTTLGTINIRAASSCKTSLRKTGHVTTNHLMMTSPWQRSGMKLVLKRPRAPILCLNRVTVLRHKERNRCDWKKAKSWKATLCRFLTTLILKIQPCVQFSKSAKSV